jgi:cobalt-zinc-cadmium efflux system protein
VSVHSHSHSHGHSRSHSHSHAGSGKTGKVLIASLVLTLAFVAVEAVAGFVSGSMALRADAVHNLTDAFGLALAAAAYYLESRPGNQIKTFGYHRMGVLAAFVNALTLAALSMLILWESYGHLMHPQPVQERLMIAVAAAGILVNAAIAWSLGGHGNDLNVRAAWIHMVGDAASCAAIIAGAVVIRYSGWVVIDPILSIGIALLIVWTAWDIFKDSLNILLEGLPKGLNLAEVTTGICCIPGVIDVHDLHIWSLGSEARALSCHVLIEDMPPSESHSILCEVNRLLEERFAIHHSTVQFEHTRCSLADVSCAPGRKSS